MMASHFHQVLIWPFRIVATNFFTARPPSERVRQFAEFLKRSGDWRDAGNVFHLATGAGNATKYAEFVYFYPFIRDFLYGDSIHVLERTGVDGVRIRFYHAKSNTDRSLDLSVRRVHLYLTHLEVAILVVEVIAPANIEFDDVLEIQDRYRRLYPPYWDKGFAGHCPDSVRWLQSGHPVGVESNYADQCEYICWVKTNWQSPASAHWSWLLRPLLPEPARPQRVDGALYFSQIQDERMPAMTFLAVDDPHSLTDGDQVRLCFLDGSGNWILPYAKDFLAGFKERYCYDRFWQIEQDYMDSRIFCCGYAFAVLGRTSSEFFTNADTGLLSHFRHHYLHLGLIAHLHRAVLLVFSDRLSEAVIQKNHDADFNRSVAEIQRDFADFVSRFWFESVSSQVQGQELFKVWSDHLGNKGLFAEVKQELDAVAGILGTNLDRQRNDAALLLTRVATFGLAGALVFGFWGLSMRTVADDLWGQSAHWHFGFVLLSGLLLAAVVASTLTFPDWYRRQFTRISKYFS